MKRLKIGLPILLVLCAFVFLRIHFAAEPDAPRFVPVASVPAISQLFYEFNYSSQGGNVWLRTSEANGTKHQYLFNIDQRKIIGEVLNAGDYAVRGFNADQTKLFCEEGAVSSGPLKTSIAAIIGRVTGGKINFPNTNPAVTLWMLDLRNSGAKKIAHVRQPYFVLGEWWRFSPGYRYASGYTFDYQQNPGLIFHAIDLDSGKVRKFKLNGIPLDWWDDRQMIIRNTNGDLSLFDVETRETDSLFSAREIEDFMSENNLRGNPLSVIVFSRGNGRQRDLYFFGGNGFLAKVDPRGPRLKLVMRQCDFITELINPNRVDPTMSYRMDMYPSAKLLSAAPGGIYLHNLTNGSTVEVLSPPAEAIGGVPAFYPDRNGPLPHFYGDKIIYRQKGELWQMDTNGSNRVKLFPPPVIPKG